VIFEKLGAEQIKYSKCAGQVRVDNHGNAYYGNNDESSEQRDEHQKYVPKDVKFESPFVVGRFEQN
jgi:hypothetical protein